MPVRKIITIDEEKCDGCGLCVPACAEGAIRIIDGKARLVSETYCDGLGACLGECPQEAITIEERPADNFDPEAVKKHLDTNKATVSSELPMHSGQATFPACPGSAMHSLKPSAEPVSEKFSPFSSRLANWPVQFNLVPPRAPYFDGADLLIAADCAPLAYPDFHRRFLDGKVALIGCPKLDDIGAYVEKLSAIFGGNDIKSIEVVFMEVPCCGGLIQLVHRARQNSGKEIPVRLTKIGIRGEIMESFTPQRAAKVAR